MKLKTLITWFDKFIDWFGKNLSRIKTFGILLSVITLIFSKGCDRQQANTFVQQITGLNIEKLQLRKQVSQMDDSLSIEKQLVKKLQADKIRLQKDSAVNAKKIADYKKSRANIPSELNNIPEDSSYKFLQAYYPYPGEKKFPFNGPQVKNIHQTVLQNENYQGENIALKTQLDNCESRVVNATETQKSAQRSFRMLEAKSDTIGKIGDITQKQLDMTSKELKKEKRRKGFWKVTSVVELVFIVLKNVL